MFSKVLELPTVSDTAEVEVQINEGAQSKDFTSEYKEKRKLAKRIVKAVQPALEDATRKESELLRKPFEMELQQLDLLLEKSLASRRDSLTVAIPVEMTETEAAAQQLVTDDHDHREQINGNDGQGYRKSLPSNALGTYTNGISETAGMEKVASTSNTMGAQQTPRNPLRLDNGNPRTPTNDVQDQRPLTNGLASAARNHQGSATIQIHEPSTPSAGTVSAVQPLANGGVPWYMETFDPDGTTVQEERWTGRELVRGMSEELSDMEDEELSGLVDAEVPGDVRREQNGSLHPNAAEEAAARRKAAAKRRRWRGYR